MEKEQCRGITQLHWACIGEEHKPLKRQGPCIALWPEPIDSDDCFAKAGFNRFEDSGDQWDREFLATCSKIFNALAHQGTPRLLSGELPMEKMGFFKQKQGTLLEALECAAQDDQFPPCCVGFGESADVFLVTSDGHPIFWIYPGPNIRPEDWLQSLNLGFGLENTDLDWSLLAPNSQRIVF